MAEEAPALPYALRADFEFMDEPSRTVLLCPDRGLRTVGQFHQRAELVKAIEAYMAERNKDPKPYRWPADGKEILAKIQRACEALANRQIEAGH